MSVKPITRMEHILAGENITPIGRKEYFVQQAVQNGGSSGETFETVAEIQVGEMERQEEQYSYKAGVESILEISETETYYLNDNGNPSTLVSVNVDTSAIGFNLKVEGETVSRVDPNKPLVIVGYGDDERYYVIVQSDTPDLSNTTVKILKKVSSPGVLPEVTSADNGDVLTVVNGAWAKAAPSTELPSVTASDNGDFLSVVNGAWAKASLPENVKPTYEFGCTVAAGSEAGTFVVTPDSGSTYAAITAALTETPNVLVRVAFGSESYVCPVSHIGTDFYNCYTNIYGDIGAGLHFYVARLRIEDDDTLDFAIEQIGE